MYQLHPDHNGVVPGSAQGVHWQHRLGAKINGGLAVVDDTVYVESFDGRVNALDARTGAPKWSTRVGNVVMTTPIVTSDSVIVGTGTSAVLVQNRSRVIWGRPEGDAIVALDRRNGLIRWQRRTIGEDMASPAMVPAGSRESIVFANGDEHVRALDAQTGSAIWETPVRGVDSMSSAAFDDGLVFLVVGGPANWKARDRLLAVDAISGAIRWRAPYGNADCSPTVADHRVFIEGSASTSARARDRNAFNDVTAIDEGNGKMLWRWYSGFGTFDSVGSDEEAIAGLASAGTFYESLPAPRQFAAFEERAGRVRWIINTRGAVKMSAVEKNGRLYFGDTAGILYIVDALTGHVLSQRTYPRFFSTSSPVIVGNTLYIADDNIVYATSVPLSS